MTHLNRKCLSFFFSDGIFRRDVQRANLTCVRQGHATRSVGYDKRHRRRTADGRSSLALIHGRIRDDRWPGQPENVRKIK